MSSRCSQTATQRVLAWSRTLTSQVPSNEMLDTYVFMAGSKSFAASRSTGNKVVETLALLVRWYSVIMQLTWFPSLFASQGRISRCKCLMARPDTSSRGAAAPPHTRKTSQRRQVSPPHLGGEREVSAQSPISLIGNGELQGPDPLEFSHSTCLSLFGPSLAVSHSTHLHQSRCVGAGGTNDRSLLHRGLLSRSLLCRSGSRPNTRPTWAHHWAFSPPV